MTKSVTIKGTGSGVIIVLDGDTPFEDLRGELRKRISSSSEFFEGARLRIRVRGRDLTEEEQAALLELVETSAQVTVTDLIIEPPVEPKKLSAEEIFARDEEEEPERDGLTGRLSFGDTEELSAVDQAILHELEKQLSGEFAIMHAGPVKSGEMIRSEYSLVILGDVREGGRVEANGSVIVLGSLFGEAVAGAEGNRSAIVVAGNLKPQALSIGSLTGYRAPLHSRKQPFGKRRLVEVACVKNGEVVRMAYSDFIRENSMR